MSAAGAGAGGELAQVSSAPPFPDPPVAPPLPSPVDATSTPRPARGGQSLVSVIVFAVLAVVSGVAGALLLQRGISTDNFPPILAGQQYTTITKYSGPWLTAAAGAALLAGLFLLAAAFGLARWLRRSRDDAARDDPART